MQKYTSLLNKYNRSGRVESINGNRESTVKTFQLTRKPTFILFFKIFGAYLSMLAALDLTNIVFSHSKSA